MKNDANKNLIDVIDEQQQPPLQKKISLFGKEESKSETAATNEKEQKIGSDLLDEELSEDAKQEVQRIIDEYVEAFNSKQQKEMAIKYTVMPLNQIIKMPNDSKWRNVQTSTSFLKQVSNINAEALEKALVSIGFSKVADKNFKFTKSATEENSSDLVSVQTDAQSLIKVGNLKTIAEAVKLLNEKLVELKKPAMAPSLNKAKSVATPSPPKPFQMTSSAINSQPKVNFNLGAEPVESKLVVEEKVQNEEIKEE